MNAQTFLWYPNGFNWNASFNLSGDFLFDFDKDFLSAKGKEVVAELARKLRTMRVQEIRVEEHTDGMGEVAYNQNLSQRRVEAVANELKHLRVTAQLRSVGFGESHQVKHCEGNDQIAKACLQPNRRVEVHASGIPFLPFRKFRKQVKLVRPLSTICNIRTHQYPQHHLFASLPFPYKDRLHFGDLLREI